MTSKPTTPRRARSRGLSKRQLQARLVERGSSFRQFALANGYQPRTVTQAVDRWAGQAQMPQGRLTYQILRDLSEAVGAEAIPGILAPEPARSVSPL